MERKFVITEAQREALRRRVEEAKVLIIKKGLTAVKPPQEASVEASDDGRIPVAHMIIPNRNVVMNIRDYFDKNFLKQYVDDVDADGYPKKSCTIVMLTSDRKPLRTISVDEFKSLADDKFHHVIKDDLDRKVFLAQVIKDWIADAISREGILSVNSIKRG